MTCLNPISIVSKAIGATAKQRMLVPCGKCIECYKDKQRRWVYRLQREQAKSGYSLFVTLTYDPEHVPMMIFPSNDIITYKEYLRRKCINDFVFSLDKTDLTKFFKRLRKFGYSFRYYASGEYGDQFDRPHFHIAFFFDGISPTNFLHAVELCWNRGNVVCDPLTDSRIYYVTKYLLKSDVEAAPDDRCVQPYSVSSHGLGLNGFISDYDFLSNLPTDDPVNRVSLNDGTQIPIPRYFRQTILIDKVEPFTIDKQFEYEKQNKIKEQLKFDKYAEKYKTKMGVKDFDSIVRSYNQSRDSERQTRIANLQRRRRKGI